MLSLKRSERPDWSSYEDYQYLEVTHSSEFVVHVQLNRPGKRNSVNRLLWRSESVSNNIDQQEFLGSPSTDRHKNISYQKAKEANSSELEDCFHKLSEDSNCRVIILSGIGAGFCAGIDFSGMKDLAGQGKKEVARWGWRIRRDCKTDEKMLTTIAGCPKPVIAAVHGACLGIGVGIVTQCDIRYATDHAFFSIKELDIGLVDSGALPRLVKKVGNGSGLTELALTARNFTAQEALEHGMISGIYGCQDEMMQEVYKLADLIASKSPVAVQGTKMTLNYAMDHSVPKSLDYVASWNMFQMQSEDTVKAALAIASRSKDPPTFSKL